MKKIKRCLLCILAACGISFSVQAVEPWPPTPPENVIDAQNDVVYYLNTAQTALNNASAQVIAFTQNLSLQAKSMLTKYVGKFKSFVGNVFKKGDKQELPGSVKIVEAKVADIYDPVSIQAAMYKLFFQYPADCEDTSNIKNYEKCRQYEEAAKLLHQKTIIEAYTVVRELEKQLPELEQSINDVETALQEGKDGSEDPNNGDVAIAKNLYNAYMTMDSILKLIEEVEALRAQYAAAQAIGTFRVRPALPEKKDADKKAENSTFPVWSEKTSQLAVIKIKGENKLGFASVANDEEDENDDSDREELTYNRMTFVDAPDMGMKSPFDGNEKDMAFMPKISQAYQYLKSAMEIHNIMQSLDAMREAYDARDKMNRYHNKTIEDLKRVEQCTINYYDTFYENAHQMWSGGLSLENAAHHDLRKGLSAWAYKAYALAKAEDTGVMIDADDFAESNVDTSDVNVDNIQEARNTIQGRMTDDPNGGFKDAKKQAELNGAMKESSLIVWNIGTEASKMLAKDQKESQQIGENRWKGKWGTAKMKYPVWKDVQNFYQQYIIEKYDSINRRLKIVNANELFLNVAKKISTVDDNKKAIENIRSLIKEQQTEPTSKVKGLIAEKKAKLAELEQKRNADLAKNKKEDEEIVRQMNAKQATLDRLSLRLQDASAARQEADKTVSAMKTLIEKLQELQENQPISKYIERTTEEYKVDINQVKKQKESSLIYKNTYERKDALLYAQLSYDNPSRSLLTGTAEKKVEIKPDIKTYEREVITEKEVEYEELESLSVAKYTYEENVKKVKTLDDEIFSLNSQIDAIKSDIEELDKKRKILEVQKEDINRKYAEDAHNVIVQYNTAIEEAEKQYQSDFEKDRNIDFVAFFNNSNNHSKIVKNLHLQNFEELLNKTSEIMAETRNVSEEIVNAARDNILAIGDLYNRDNPNIAGQIYNHHKNMIEALKHLPEQNLLSKGSIHEYSAYGIISLLRDIYTDYLVNDACINNSCLTEKETTYFAGIMGSRRDFLVPILAPESNLPSVREVLYFDFADFDRIPKTAEGYVSPNDVVKNLSYLPDIWKKMLSSPAFVEKDINLGAFLSGDKITGSIEKLGLGGMFPCWYPDADKKQYLVVWKGNRFAVYDQVNAGKKVSGTGSGMGTTLAAGQIAADKEAYENIKKKNYLACQNLYIEKKHSGFFGTTSTVIVRNIAETTEDQVVQSEVTLEPFSDFKLSDSESELGYLFEYDGRGLKYNWLAKTMFGTISDLNKGIGVSNDPEALQRNAMYNVSSLIHSQIGEFLRAVDFEQEMLKSVEELDEEIKNNKQMLKEIFVKIEPDENKRFVPADNIDLSKDEDYNLIKSKLAEYKNNKLNAAISLLSAAQGSSHEVVQDRLKKVNNMITLMKKDNDVYVILGDTMDAGAELDEKIKTERVNREVAARQKEEADRAFEEELKKTTSSYCLQLLDNM